VNNIQNQYKVRTENARLERRYCKRLGINISLQLPVTWSCECIERRFSVFEYHDAHKIAVLSLAVTSRLNRILHLALKKAISLHNLLRAPFRAPVVPPVLPELARTQHDSLRRHGVLSE
jgi:hypothetical protein